MKTIKQGVVPEPKPWWPGIELSCPICEGEFRLEEADKPRKASDGRFVVKCPTKGCKTNGSPTLIKVPSARVPSHLLPRKAAKSSAPKPSPIQAKSGPENATSGKSSPNGKPAGKPAAPRPAASPAGIGVAPIGAGA